MCIRDRFRTLAHKGTRAPSPDKLLPLTFTRGCSTAARHTVASISEYTEPSDQHSYVYSEVLYSRRPQTGPPDVVLEAEYMEPHDYKVPVYSEVGDFTNPPLPIRPTRVVSRINKDDDQSSETQ